MAFTFQINNDVKFKHDENLLKKAEENRPEIKYRTVTPKKIVELCENVSMLGGCGVQESIRKVSELESYGLKRNDKVVLDFGEHLVGKFQITIHSVGSPMDAPLTLKIKFAEVPAELASESSEYDGWLSKSWIQEEIIHIDELPTVLHLSRRYSFRYVELQVVDTSPKWQAVFSNPLVIAESSADEKKLKRIVLKNITEEDTVLQKICDVSVKTLAECMQDVFEDGPKRDRRLWLGDLRLQALANYASFDNIELVKRCMYLFAAMTTEEGKIPANVFVKPENCPDDTFLFDYSLFFISTLYDFISIHPDKEFLEEMYPIAKKQMDLSILQIDERGKLLWDDEYPVFVDWSNEFNKKTAGQAIIIYTLKQFIWLAERMEDKDINRYQDILEKLVQYSKAELFDSKRHLFISGAEKEYNIASQVWMVLADIFPKEENNKIMECTIKELFPVRGIATPYMYHHVVEALFHADMKGEAVKLMKEYWGKMIALGADTYWEAFDPEQPDYSPYGNPIVSSYCHAWGCTPVYLIQKYLMD